MTCAPRMPWLLGVVDAPDNDCDQGACFGSGQERRRRLSGEQPIRPPKKENSDIQGTATGFKRKQPGLGGDESQKDVLWNSIGKSFGGAVSIYMDLGPAWLACRYTEVQKAVTQPHHSLSSQVQIITPFSAS